MTCNDMIDAQPTRELLCKLVARGHTVAHVAEVIDYSQSVLCQVRSGRRARIREWVADELQRCEAEGLFGTPEPQVDEIVLGELIAGHDEYALDIRRGEKYVYARRLAERGLHRTQIGRLLHASNASVRQWLDLGPVHGPARRAS